MQGNGGSLCFGASPASDEYGGADNRLTIVEVGGRVSDVDMASRKAEEAAGRRAVASTWINKIVASARIPAEPTEEQLRTCLRNGAVLCRLINRIEPRAVSKVVESTSSDGSQSAFQYFENLRNFLDAAQEMRLPTFEICDLEQVTGSVSKVVDCILALKSYNEWKQTGALGSWKYAGSLRSPLRGNVYPRGLGRSVQTDKISNSRKRLLSPDVYAEAQPPLAEEPTGLMGSKGQSYEDDPVADIENRPQDSTSAWINHLTGKLRELLKVKPMQDSVLGENHSAANGVEAFTLSAVVKNVLAGKEANEIPAIVELMIKKTVVECQQRQQDKTSPSTSSEEKPLKNTKIEQSLVAAMDEIKLLKLTHEHAKEEASSMKQMWQHNMQWIESQMLELADDAAGYRNALADNRRLYNEVQDLKGSIRVYCRVRPSSDAGTVEFIGENGEIMISNKDSSKSFCFNKIFGPAASQESVYVDTQPLIRSVLDGYNVCIFAYGQTGSGKTYTMSGPDNLTEDTWGVNYRALHDLFQISTDRQKMFEYEIVVQFLEIYNEQLRDLLAPDTSTKKLEIRNSSQKNGINVPDAIMMPVKSTEDVMQLMKMGQRNRAVGSTALNERSSRSHSVLTIHVRGTDSGTRASSHGSLHLIDLAGSERVDKSEATGDRLKEAQHINKSLSALGDVIAALSTKNSHIPYRNSKLTQLLQDSLGGQAKALMFVHMSPEIDSYNETISTLKFAERAATVELGAAKSNRESGDVRALKDQVTALKDALNKKEAELEKVRVSSIARPRPLASPVWCPPVSGDSQAEDISFPFATTADEVFESCLSSASSCPPPLTIAASPRILRERPALINSRTTIVSAKAKQKLSDVSSSMRKTGFSKYGDQNSETVPMSPSSIRKPSQQWRTPLQSQKIKSADPRRSCVDLGRRYSAIGAPADCSSAKRSSLGTKAAAESDKDKPVHARHLFNNQTTTNKS